MFFTQEHAVAGWNAVIVGTTILVMAFVYPLCRKAWLKNPNLVAFLSSDSPRMIMGLVFFCLGVAVRIGGWVPWRGMRLAENQEWVTWWADLATLWSTFGTWSIVLGATMFMWPSLVRVAGKSSLACLLVLSLQTGFFAVGVLITEIVAAFL